MVHRAWSSIVEVPYCFSRSYVKFQGHTALKIIEFDPNWAFPDSNSSLNSPMAMKCCTKLETAKERCPIVFQGHPSNFKVTRDITSPILTQIGRFRIIGRSQLSNPSDLPCSLRRPFVHGLFVSWGSPGWRLFVMNSRPNIHVTINCSTVLPLVLGVVTRQKPQINGSVVLGADESPWPCGTPSWYTPLSWMILSKQKNLYLFLSQYNCVFPYDVRLSVTPFWQCSHHRIIMKHSGVITNDQSDVHAKGQGQRSKVKVTEVKTQLNRFRTVTPVWIHIWWWNDAQSLMMLRRGALLFFKVICQISRSHG